MKFTTPEEGTMNYDVSLITLSFYPSADAGSRLMSDLAFGLQKRGLKTRVITSNRSYLDSKEVFISEEIIEGVKVDRVSIPKLDKNKTFQKFIMYWLFGKKAVRELKNANTLTVFSLIPPLFAPLMVTRYAHKSGIPSVFLIYDLLPDAWINLGFIKDGTAYRILRNQLKKTLDLASSVVVIGRDMKEYVIKNYCKQNENKVSYIPNWANNDRNYHDNELLANMNDKFLIMYGGNFGEAQDFQSLLEAARIVKEKDKSILFIMVGNGRKEEALKEYVAENSLDNVKFLGYKEDKEYRCLLSACSALVLVLNEKSKGTGVPSKFYYYLSSKKPIVAIVPNESEIDMAIREDSSGISCSVKDTEGIVDAILKLKNNRNLCEYYGQNAYRSYIEKYSSKAIIDKYYDLVKGLIDS